MYGININYLFVCRIDALNLRMDRLESSMVSYL